MIFGQFMQIQCFSVIHFKTHLISISYVETRNRWIDRSLTLLMVVVAIAASCIVWNGQNLLAVARRCSFPLYAVVRLKNEWSEMEDRRKNEGRNESAHIFVVCVWICIGNHFHHFNTVTRHHVRFSYASLHEHSTEWSGNVAQTITGEHWTFQY